jgi:hypothetical protein
MISYHLASGTALELGNFGLYFVASVSATHPSNTVLDFRVFTGPVPDGRFHPKALSEPEIILGVF